MNALYNEIEPFAVEWLRNLIASGELPAGDVDDRSIEDLTGSDLVGRGQRHFFAGIGGWPLALRIAGIPDDADIWTGSCPCQPFSSASRGRGGGFGSKADLWPAWHRLIRECRPSIIFGEQVATGLGPAWLAGVGAALEDLGYAFASADLCGSLLGYPGRERFFFVANAHGEGERARTIYEEVARVRAASRVAGCYGPQLHGVDADSDGLPCRMGVRRAYGNGVIPELAAVFVESSLAAIGGLK